MDNKTIQDTLCKLAEELEETNTDISNILYTVAGSMYIPEYMEKLCNICREFCLSCKKDAEERIKDLQNNIVPH